MVSSNLSNSIYFLKILLTEDILSPECYLYSLLGENVFWILLTDSSFEMMDE